MKAAEKLFKLLDKFAFALAATAVGGMLFCVFLQVIARILLLRITWTTELSQYFFLWSTAFAGYIAARRGKLIGVEAIQKKTPEPVQRVLKFVSWGAAAFFYGLVIYYCVIQLPSLMRQTTPMLKWSMGMIYIIMMVGLALMSAYFLFLAVQGLLAKQANAGGAEKKTVQEIVEEVE